MAWRLEGREKLNGRSRPGELCKDHATPQQETQVLLQAKGWDKVTGLETFGQNANKSPQSEN